MRSDKTPPPRLYDRRSWLNPCAAGAGLPLAAHGESSGSADVGEEGVDFRAQDVGFAAERAGRAQHLAGGRPGLSRGGADTDDVAGNLRGAAGGVLDVAGD